MNLPPISFYPGLYLSPSSPATPPPPPALTLLDNLLGHWEFSEPSASDNANDSSTNNEYLIQTGNPGVDEGQLFRILDGSTQYFQDKSSQNAPPWSPNLTAKADKSYCISIWVKFNDTEVNNILLAAQNSSNGANQVKLFYNADLGALRFSFYANDFKSVDIGETIYNNTLYHILAWYDKPNGKIRIRLNNGTIYENTQSGNPYSSADTVIIGASVYPSLADLFNGQLHDMSIWSDLVPSDAVATALYNSGDPLPHSEYGNTNV